MDNDRNRIGFTRTIYGIEGLRAVLAEQAEMHDLQVEHAATQRKAAEHRGTAMGFREALRALNDTDFDRSPEVYEEGAPTE